MEKKQTSRKSLVKVICNKNKLKDHTIFKKVKHL